MNENKTTACNTYNTTNGFQASTTGNITGIYDMSGGANEYVAAYINNNNTNLTTYANLVVNATDNHINIYDKGTTDDRSNNYTVNKYIYGDAVWETSVTGENSTAWYGDASYMPYSGTPWFVRGGTYNDTTIAGLFFFSSGSGASSVSGFFRPVIFIK